MIENHSGPGLPYPQVRSVTVIRLDRDDYRDGRDILGHLAEQTRHLPDGGGMEVHLGIRAVQLWPSDLEQRLASACYLADWVDIKTPGGTKHAEILTAGVRRKAQQMRADHAQMLAGLRRDTG